jgi:hypothetical protein
MFKGRRPISEDLRENTSLNFPETDKANSRESKPRRRWLAISVVCVLSLGVFGAGMKYLDDSARAEIAKQKLNPLAKQNESLLAKINPFIPAPTPVPTPQHSKDYIYAGSRLLAVEDDGASAIPPADLAYWRPSDGNWYCMGGANSQAFTVAWGIGNLGDKPVPGDYDGDGKTDLAIYRTSTGVWWIYPSGGGALYTATLGNSGDVTAQADYDGGGKTDPAMYHTNSGNGYWNIFKSSTQTQVTIQYGLSSDVPAPADFDGDGKADLAVWRDSTTTFWAQKSSDGAGLNQALSSSGLNVPVPADYDGDGKADFAIRHNNDWVIKQSSDGTTSAVTWYTSDYKEVQNDYDGDGKVDIAVWQTGGKGAGTWYIRQSKFIGLSNELRQTRWGAAGDTPVPAYYRR